MKLNKKIENSSDKVGCTEQTSLLELTEDELIVLSELLAVAVRKTQGTKTQPYLVSIENKVKKLNQAFDSKVD